ncbi:hypothetical protein EDC01DRAFT_718151 [Geopyxis carbonaria]|nr:hypothetical protein EDC01DRAFT_718151 [Geopyxis carbonaria]
MPTYSTVSAPGTPPDEMYDFAGLFVNPSKSSPVTEDNVSVFSSMEAILPPMVNPLSPAPSSLEAESCIPSPRPASLAGGPSWLTTTEMFPEMTHLRPTNELVSSPLHPPTKSPLMSPSIASGSQTSLNGCMAPPVLTHKKVPSIDPATPLAPRKAAVPLTLVTANSLADMIEEMNTDLNAYDATRTRMIESGWSSPQEIKNVELQRNDKARAWQERIAESKKILEGMRRSEVKHSAMSSVSSFDTALGSAPLTSSHVTPLSSAAASVTTIPKMPF